MINLSQSNQSVNILLCEDNPGDVFIIRNALRKSQVSYNFHHVDDGEMCMKFLHHEVEYENTPEPHLLLLDLNLPKKQGFEVLEDIKQDPKLKSLPVIVLTSSNAEQDILKSYNLYASCYVTKPFEYSDFVETVEKIESFWLQLVKLPPLVNNN